MGLFRVLTLSLSVLFIVSCAPEPPPKKTIFDPMTKQLDRARAVQNTVDANTDATRKAVDTQERGDATP